MFDEENWMTDEPKVLIRLEDFDEVDEVFSGELEFADIDDDDEEEAELQAEEWAESH